MKSLRPYLNKNTLLGIDANCVPDETADLKRQSRSPYDNAGANELHAAVTHFDLSDATREYLGKSPFFTYHKNTSAGMCYTRIDQIYTPNMDGLLFDFTPSPPS